MPEDALHEVIPSVDGLVLELIQESHHETEGITAHQRTQILFSSSGYAHAGYDWRLTSRDTS